MKALVVDDSVAQANQLTKILTDLGHEVVGHARTGAIAVRLYEKMRPDIVFLDIVMPEMDGLTALRLIRNHDETARVVMLTSKAGVGGDVSQALQLGALGVIAKPIVAEEISKMLDRIGADIP